MKRRFIIILFVIGIVLVLAGTSIVFISEKNLFSKEKNPQTETKKATITFKDISFLKDDSNSNNKFEPYKDKYIIVEKKIYDLDGNLIVDLSKYTTIETGYEDHIKADNDIYNLKGKLIFDGSNYTNVVYKDNYFVVKKDDKFALLDANKKEILNYDYSYIEVKSSQCIFLLKPNKNGRNLLSVYNAKTQQMYGPYINSNYFTDELIITEKYSGDSEELLIDSFFDNNELEIYTINISKNKETRRKDLDGYSFIFGELINNKYVTANKWYEAAKLRKPGVSYGIFDMNLNEKIPFVNDNITIYDNQYILLTQKNTHQILSLSLKEIVTFESDIYPYNITKKGNLYEVELKQNISELYNEKGKLVYKPDVLTTISYIGDNKYIVNEYENEKCLYLDFDKDEFEKEIEYNFCISPSTPKNNSVVKVTDKGHELYNNKLEKKSFNTYDSIVIEDNFLIVEKNEKYMIVSHEEKSLVNNEFKSYEYIDNGVYKLTDENEKIYYFSYK